MRTLLRRRGDAPVLESVDFETSLPPACGGLYAPDGFGGTGGAEVDSGSGAGGDDGAETKMDSGEGVVAWEEDDAGSPGVANVCTGVSMSEVSSNSSRVVS